MRGSSPQPHPNESADSPGAPGGDDRQEGQRYSYPATSRALKLVRKASEPSQPMGMPRRDGREPAACHTPKNLELGAGGLRGASSYWPLDGSINIQAGRGADSMMNAFA